MYGIIKPYIARLRIVGDCMFLQEIDVESKVTILVRIGSQTLAFDTVVEEPSDDGILTQPIYRDEKLIGFKTKGLIITLQICNKSDEKVYEFNNVEILNVKTKDGTIHHKMSCKNPGKQINRRTAVRVWLGIEGVARVGANRTAYTVIIKDISVSGISFILHKDMGIEAGEMAHITFNDIDAKVKFSLSAIVVRTAEMEDGRVLYGCRLNQESPAISRYVAEKQREKLKSSRTVGTTVPLEKKE